MLRQIVFRTEANTLLLNLRRSCAAYGRRRSGHLDIGGESTRPYASPVAAEEELQRIAPILEALQGRTAIPISIDTSKASVARAAIQLGAQIVNDVTG